jgi:hypothetical protein
MRKGQDFWIFLSVFKKRYTFYDDDHYFGDRGHCMNFVVSHSVVSMTMIIKIFMSLLCFTNRDIYLQSLHWTCEKLFRYANQSGVSGQLMVIMVGLDKLEPC